MIVKCTYEQTAGRTVGSPLDGAYSTRLDSRCSTMRRAAAQLVWQRCTKTAQPAGGQCTTETACAIHSSFTKASSSSAIRRGATTQWLTTRGTQPPTAHTAHTASGPTAPTDAGHTGALHSIASLYLCAASKQHVEDTLCAALTRCCPHCRAAPLGRRANCQRIGDKRVPCQLPSDRSRVSALSTSHSHFTATAPSASSQAAFLRFRSWHCDSALPV